MDIGLREWLIVIGIIVIAGILFDGWRRMRGGKNKLKLKLDRSYANMQDDDIGDPDVLGPARVLERQHEPQLDDDDFPSVDMQEVKRRKPIEPTQGDLILGLDDQPVPTLLSPVDEGEDDDAKPAAASAEALPVEEVLVINVIARNEEGFKGPALLQDILESGLRFGEMDIFHRHESMAGNGEIFFSMANGVKPGTFDLDDIDHFSTRAVSFFMSLPGPRYPRRAFDLMIASARKLASSLDGELKDDQRSVLTSQTIEHYRQRIAEFERRQLTQKR